jgi:hypothetical protein
MRTARRCLKATLLGLVVTAVLVLGMLLGFAVARALPSWVYDDPAPGGRLIHAANVSMAGIALGLVLGVGGLLFGFVTYVRLQVVVSAARRNRPSRP